VDCLLENDWISLPHIEEPDEVEVLEYLCSQYSRSLLTHVKRINCEGASLVKAAIYQLPDKLCCPLGMV
jgi:hypothetical protein